MTAIGKDILDRLLARGRERGHLTTEDLEQELPVESLSPDDIALVVAHLEDRGVPVELDERLTGPAASRSAPGRVPDLELAPERREPSPAAPPHAGGEGIPAAAAPVSPGPPRGMRGAHLAVALAGLAVLVLLVLAVALLG